MSSPLFRILTYLSVAGALNAQTLLADDELSIRTRDSHKTHAALAQIIGEQVLVRNVAAVREEFRRLPETRRFEAIANWVLPCPRHSTWRLQYEFVSSGSQVLPSSQLSSRVIAPALDLIDLAQSTNRLSELRERIQAIAAAETDNVLHRRNQMVLLILIDLAAGHTDAAEKQFDEFCELGLPPPTTDRSELAADTLLLTRMIEVPEFHEEVLDHSSRIAEPFLLSNDRDPWELCIWEIYSRMRIAESNPGQTLLSSSSLRRWSPVARRTATARGNGYPEAEWVVRDDAVEKIVGHDRDFLFYQSPLRGNFAVEADVTGFGYRGGYLSYADVHVIPYWDLKHLGLSRFRNPERLFLLPSTMAKPEERIRYRMEVEDGVMSTSFNGRQVYKCVLQNDDDPWLSFCSPIRFRSGIRDVRIFGKPEIPSEIRMATCPQLRGWAPYFSDRVNHDGTYDEASNVNAVVPDQIHRFDSAQIQPRVELSTSHWLFDYTSADGGLIGRKEELYQPFCFRESLLQYHRPILEDGVIEYDFFWSETVAAHPSIDRTVFLLRPDGVHLHHITDSRWDRSSAAADAELFDAANQLVDSLPLNANAWNRLTLAISGDDLQLSINGTAVFRQQLSEAGQRTFGLFHYSDQTELRVRNLRWKGSWPKHLPSAEHQELAGTIDELPESRPQELTASFEHDFVKNGAPRELFAIKKGDWAELQNVANGVLATKQGPGRYSDVAIAPRLVISGDFDITSSFEDFIDEGDDAGTHSVMLAVQLDTPESRSCELKRSRHPGGGANYQRVRCIFDRFINRKRTRSYFHNSVTECRSGTLKLSRRGDTVYFLLAEGRSTVFRLLNQQKVGTEPLIADGLSLRVQVHSKSEGSRTSVVWKKLAIKAERISESRTPIQNNAEELAQLNMQREQLPVRYTADYTKQSVSFRGWMRWGTVLASVPPNANGLQILSTSNDERWMSSGAYPRIPLAGDFDAVTTFDIARIVATDDGGKSNIYLQAEFDDPAKTQISLVYALGESQSLTARITEPLESGRGYKYLISERKALSDVKRLRMARRGNTVWCLATVGESGPEHIVGKLDIAHLGNAAAEAKFLVHSEPEPRETHVHWKEFELRASDR